jgi:hypothetical protein
MVAFKVFLDLCELRDLLSHRAIAHGMPMIVKMQIIFDSPYQDIENLLSPLTDTVRPAPTIAGIIARNDEAWRENERMRTQMESYVYIIQGKTIRTPVAMLTMLWYIVLLQKNKAKCQVYEVPLNYIGVSDEASCVCPP